MSSWWPGTSDDAEIGGDVGAEREHQYDRASDRLPESARRALVSLLTKLLVRLQDPAPHCVGRDSDF